MVHGGDFVASGHTSELIWLGTQVEGELEITTTIMANGDGHAKEVRILNRKFVWHDGVGMSCEADPEHAEVLIRDTGALHFTALKTPITWESKESDQIQTEDAIARKRPGKVKEAGESEEPSTLSAEDTTK